MSCPSVPQRVFFLESVQARFDYRSRFKDQEKESTADDLDRALRLHSPLTASAECIAPVIRASLEGGSRFRAKLSLQVSNALGLAEGTAQRIACAMEFFHSASLILDDLPCMDDATERRNRICAHLLHGESRTILAALALLSRAYSLLGVAVSGLDAASQTAAHRLIETCLGVAGAVGGQARDISFQPHWGGSQVAQIALHKTGSLIRLALELPALVAGAPPSTCLNLRRLGSYWGLLYQGIDDWNDEWGMVATTGKTSHRDGMLARPNIVRAWGASRAEAYIARLVRLSNHALRLLSSDQPTLGSLTDIHATLVSRWQAARRQTGVLVVDRAL